MSENEKNEAYYMDNVLILRKSNALIGAKYKTNLLENQLLSIAMTRIEVDAKSPDAPIKARLYPTDINKLINKGKNIYRELKIVSNTLASHPVTIEDGSGNFKVFAFITEVTYENQVLEITFSENIRPHILGLQKNYTTLNLSILTGFVKNASFRIYEILQKEMYRSRNSVNSGMVSVTYNLNELRFMIGLANSEEAAVQRYIAKNRDNVDWDYLYEHVAIEKSYGVWQDLKKRVLNPAQKELAESSDIRFEYEGIRQGGNKIRKIRFDIYPNVVSGSAREALEKRAKVIEEESSEEYRQSVQQENTYQGIYREFVGHNNLSYDDISLLLSKAKYDEETVRSAIKMADKQTEISNYMGWLLKCIEGGWSEPVEVVAGSDKKANIIKEAKNDMASPEFQKIMWEKLTQKDDFPDFLEYIKLSRNAFESIYEDPKERAEVYADWKTGRI